MGKILYLFKKHALLEFVVYVGDNVVFVVNTSLVAPWALAHHL